MYYLQSVELVFVCHGVQDDGGELAAAVCAASAALADAGIKLTDLLGSVKL
jgi:ribonuclease PH